MTITNDSKERKDIPLYSGCIDYFPDALAEVARVSQTGNDKHNPGEPLHWSRDKSTDHLDCIARHLLEAGILDTDGHYHDAKIAWRALANLQVLLEQVAADEANESFTMTPGEWQALPKGTIHHGETYIYGCKDPRKEIVDEKGRTLDEALADIKTFRLGPLHTRAWGPHYFWGIK